MRLDQITRTLSRVARVGGITLRDDGSFAFAGAGESEAQPKAAAPKGSGSWAREWATDTRPAEAPAPPAMTTKPLLDGAAMRLHNWLADRLEEEAPDCALHAKVALSAFLGAPGGLPETLAALSVDLLVVDARGHACLALVREGHRRTEDEAAILDAIESADLPVLLVPARPQAARLWEEVRRHLPAEDDGDDAAF